MRNRLNKENVEKIVDLMARSISFRNENRHGEALECLDRGLKIDPNFFPLLVEKGFVLREMGRCEEAVEHLDRFLQFLPHLPLLTAALMALVTSRIELPLPTRKPTR